MAIQCLVYFGLSIPLLFSELFLLNGIYLLRCLETVPASIAHLGFKIYPLASLSADIVQKVVDSMTFFSIASLIAILINVDNFSIYNLEIAWNLAWVGSAQVLTTLSTSPSITVLRLRSLLLKIVNTALFNAAVKKSIKRYTSYDWQADNLCYRALPKYYDRTGDAALYSAYLALVFTCVNITIEVMFLLERYRQQKVATQIPLEQYSWVMFGALRILYEQGIFVYFAYSIVCAIEDVVTMIILNSPLISNGVLGMQWGFGQVMAVGVLIAFYIGTLPEVICES